MIMACVLNYSPLVVSNSENLAVCLKLQLACLYKKLRLIRLVWVNAVSLLLLLNDECKLKSLQEDGSRTR